MNTIIIDRGRGPEIAGTRITVYDVWDYARVGHHHTTIAATLGLSSIQVAAALKYIEKHKDEVLADYQQILERMARGNAPEVEAKLQQSQAKLQALREKLQQAKAGTNHEGNSRRQ
jgi:uncharacterized protein (DUF433 family)